MRKLTLVSLILVLWAVIAGSAPLIAAQPARPTASQQDAEFARISRELGLTKKQEVSIKAIVAKLQTDMRKAAESKASSESKTAKQRAIAAEAQKKIAGLLTAAQRKKLDQMTRVQNKPSPRQAKQTVQTKQPEHRATFAEGMQNKLSRLNLTKQQRAKTDAILKDFVKRHAANKKDTKLDPTKKRAKADALKGEAMKKIEAVLTPDQRKKFKERL